MAITLGSANVCTLCPRDEDAANAAVGGDLLMGKVQVMEMRFREARVQILGIQEGRARRQEVRSGLYYDMLWAPPPMVSVAARCGST